LLGDQLVLRLLPLEPMLAKEHDDDDAREGHKKESPERRSLIHEVVKGPF
jgi:hypothetical protein